MIRYRILGPLAAPGDAITAHPGSTFDALDVAALTGLCLDGTRDSLDDLVDLHLIEEPAPDAYRMHDLLQGSMSVALGRRYLTRILIATTRLRLQPLEAEARNDLAGLLRAEGRYDEATSMHREALAIVRRIAETNYEAEFLTELAVTRRAAGDLAEARDLYEQVWRIARRAGFACYTAVSEAGLAECLAGTDREAARTLWGNALAAFREMGVPERASVARRLAAMDQ